MEDREAYSESLKQKLTQTGVFLRSQFDDVSAKRCSTEERFLQDLRQYKGIYDPSVAKRLSKSRSRLFTRITRTKIKAFDARIMEMLFPANNDKNWEIAPTPKPDLVMSPMTQALMDEAQAQKVQMMAEQVAQQQGQDPKAVMKAMIDSGQVPPLSQQEVMEVGQEAVTKACNSMRTEIEDQLAEIKYRHICKKSIHSGNLFGTGIMKGPLVQKKQYQQWQMGEESQWGMGHSEKVLPYLEFVKVWDFYPDPEAKSLEEWRVHVSAPCDDP